VVVAVVVVAVVVVVVLVSVYAATGTVFTIQSNARFSF